MCNWYTVRDTICELPVNRSVTEYSVHGRSGGRVTTPLHEFLPSAKRGPVSRRVTTSVLRLRLSDRSLGRPTWGRGWFLRRHPGALLSLLRK